MLKLFEGVRPTLLQFFIPFRAGYGLYALYALPPYLSLAPGAHHTRTTTGRARDTTRPRNDHETVHTTVRHMRRADAPPGAPHAAQRRGPARSPHTEERREERLPDAAFHHGRVPPRVHLVPHTVLIRSRVSRRPRQTTRQLS